MLSSHVYVKISHNLIYASWPELELTVKDSVDLQHSEDKL